MGPILLVLAPPSSFPASSFPPRRVILLIVSIPPSSRSLYPPSPSVSSSLYPPRCFVVSLLLVISPCSLSSCHSILLLLLVVVLYTLSLAFIIGLVDVMSPSFDTPASCHPRSLAQPCIFQYVGLGILTPSCLLPSWCRDPYTFVSFDTLVLGSHSLRVPCRK